MDEKKKQAYWTGVVVLILLVALTIGEFFVGRIAYAWWFILIGISIIKAYYVIRDYMHISRFFAAFSTDEEVNE